MAAAHRGRERHHIGLAQPVIMNGRKGNQAQGVDSAPVPTLDTKGGVWLAEPLTGGAAEDHPGCARPMLVQPFILNRHGDNGGSRAHDVEEPVPTTDCRGSGYLLQPFVLSRQSEGAPRSTDQPMPTQTAVHAPVLISPYYGAGSGETCKSAEEPLDTVTSKGRFGMVVPITHADGGNRARDTETDPLPTITTAHRGELAFIAAQLGGGTVYFDILFRMLEPHELAGAMGFTSEEATYEFAGTKTDQIKQIGNAVSVSKMKACVGALMADAAPRKKLAANPLAIAAE
jgi:DNA (cytosine-5)-methyltransferase 1